MFVDKEKMSSFSPLDGHPPHTYTRLRLAMTAAAVDSLAEGILVPAAHTTEATPCGPREIQVLPLRPQDAYHNTVI